MTDSGASEGAAVAEAAAHIIGRMRDKLADISSTIEQLVVTEVAELREDPELLQLMRDTVTSSVDTFFSAIRLDIPIRQVEPPAAALEYARRLAQREVSVNALMRGYRLGHRTTLRAMIGEIRAAKLDPQLGFSIYDVMEAVSFDYIDQLSQQLTAAYEAEHDRWLERRNNLRTVQVRELLEGGDVDVDAVTTALRYPLARHHLAVVGWSPEPYGGTDAVPLERFVQRLAESLGARDAPLFIPVDRVTGWAWIALSAEAASNAVAGVRAFVEDDSGHPRLAVGNPLPGVAGFRRSHEQAQEARAVVLASDAATHRVTAFSDTGLAVAALVADDPRAASVLVAETLGPLAAATDNDERLRRTLRVFLRAGSSYTAAAEELHLHHNSVKYRVQRAVERRGRPITDDRLDVEVALLLCEWFDRAVLQ